MLAGQARRWLKEQNVESVEPETAASITGYKNVIVVRRKWFQARVHVPAKDGQPRRQLVLPGLFETALEAAQYRALMMKHDAPTPEPAPRRERGQGGELPPARACVCAD